MCNSPVYAVMLEWKNEGPLVMESKPLTYDEASAKLSAAIEQPKVIRGAVVELKYEHGNAAVLTR